MKHGLLTTGLIVVLAGGYSMAAQAQTLGGEERERFETRDIYRRGPAGDRNLEARELLEQANALRAQKPGAEGRERFGERGSQRHGPDGDHDLEMRELLEQVMANLDFPAAGEPAESGEPSGDDQAAALAAERTRAEALALAADTIEELQDRLERAERDLDQTQADLQQAQERRGVFGWLAERVESLGFGLGWWTMYFAVLMPWMKGQTPGKRVMGLRVVRLDGQPVTWWHAFERAGGYAAGLATGTLGFAQIYWDPNRQGIHDKIAGTVVTLDGAPKVPGRWDLPIQPADEKTG